MRLLHWMLTAAIKQHMSLSCACHEDGTWCAPQETKTLNLSVKSLGKGKTSED